MQQLGLNNDVLVGGRRFHVQTAYTEGTRAIISHIFDSGRIVDKQEIAIESDANGEALPGKLNAVHQEMISEMEMLFNIAEKVRQAKHAGSCNKLGLLFLHKNLFDDAVLQFQSAIALDRELIQAYKNLGIAFVMKGDFAAAEETLGRGVELADNYADFYNYMGLAQLEQKKYEEALHSLRTALELNPEYVDAHFNMALLLVRTLAENVEQDFLPTMEERAQRSVDHLARAYDGASAYHTPRVEKAIQAVSDNAYAPAQIELDMVKQDVRPEVDKLFEHEFFLKFMYGGKGKDEAFIERYAENLRAAIREYPEYADLHNNLGVAYLIQCRNLFVRALEEFRQALKINPGFKRAEKNLKLAENDGKGFLILLRAIMK
jgi:tetratricopeptide (TPR) repeat protein